MASDDNKGSRLTFTEQEALQFHAQGKPGKLEVSPTKPMATQRDLSLAYSPGVAVPVLAIAEDSSRAFDYTGRGNMVAVISNGTAILGLGNLGALASKPVMEGKAVLFKRFADVNSIDLEVDTEDVDEFIAAVRHLGPSFGGINLEDIKAPDCFIIEQQLREVMNIPVFHDDQHGTAIIALAGLINALHLTGRAMADNPIIFAMANPDPEMTPEEVATIRDDAIVATGRSDYPNQINNVLGFPYIFRGALDVRATTINDEMKIAAAEALALLTRDEEEQVIRTAFAFRSAGLGTPILVGRDEPILETMKSLGHDDHTGIEIVNARISERNVEFAEFLYSRLQRSGYLLRDCQRLVNTDRNTFASCILATGGADALVTGVTRNYAIALKDIRRVVGDKPGHRVVGISIMISRGRTVLVADTAIHDVPTPEELADIVVEAAGVARRLGYEPHVALLATSSFGYPTGNSTARVRMAVDILNTRHVDFEFDGEIAADVALSREQMEAYPFRQLTEPANVLVMPAMNSASISTNMLQELGGSTVIGPLLVGLDKSVQIVPLGATDNYLMNMAAIAAYGISG